jgi:hypothetical protein
VSCISSHAEALLTTHSDGTTTSVVYTTATLTITKCAASVTICPVAGTTEVFTSTTVMSVTTTMCAAPYDPGLSLTPSTLPLPTGPAGTTNTQPNSVPIPYDPGVSESGSAHIPSIQTSALPTGASPSVGHSVSLVSPNPSLPIPTTGSGSASSPSGVSGLSNVNTLPAETSELPTGPAETNTVIVPGPSSPGSITGPIPTSIPTAASGSSSSLGPVPQPSTAVQSVPSQPTTDTNTGATATSGGAPTSGHGQLSTPIDTATQAVPTSGSLGSNAGQSSGAYTPVSSNTNAVPSSGYSMSSVGPGLSSGTYVPTVPSNTSGVPSSAAPGSGTVPTAPGASSSLTVPTYSATNAIPTSGYSASTASSPSEVYPPSVPSNSNAAPTSGTNTASVASSLPQAPSYTATNAVPTSGSTESSVTPSSGAYSPSSASETASNAAPPSGYPVPSGVSTVSVTGAVSTNTGSIPSSVFSPSFFGEYPPSGTSAPPTQETSVQSYPSGSIPVAPSGPLSTVSGTYPAVTSIGSGSAYPGSPPAASTTVAEGTSQVTGSLVLTSTDYVTALLPSSNPSTDTDTNAAYTSRGTGYLPSGSG